MLNASTATLISSWVEFSLFNTSLADSTANINSAIAFGVLTPSANLIASSASIIAASNSVLSTTTTLDLKASTAVCNSLVIVTIPLVSVTTAKSASALAIAAFSISTASWVYWPFPDPITAFSTFSLAIANTASYFDSSSAISR